MKLTPEQQKKLLAVIDTRIESAVACRDIAIKKMSAIPSVPASVCSPYALEGAYDVCVRAISQMERECEENVAACGLTIFDLKIARDCVVRGFYPHNW